MIEWLKQWMDAISRGEVSMTFLTLAKYANKGPGGKSLLFVLALASVTVLGGMVFLTVYSYLREGEVRRRVKLTLAGIRIAVIVLAMIILLRPAIRVFHKRTLFSDVVLLFDDSMSMGLNDRHAADDYKETLAAKLGVSTTDVEKMSRLELARDVLKGPDGLIGKLSVHHPVTVMRFPTTQPGAGQYAERVGGTIGEMVPEKDLASAEAVAKARVAGGASGAEMLAALTAQGPETNIPAGLRGAVEHLRGKRGAVVLVSDGRTTAPGGASRLAALRELAAQRGLPIYTVKVGEPTPPRNLAVVGLNAPRTIRVAAEAGFSAKLIHRGFGGEQVEVKLQRRKEGTEDWTDVTRKNVTLEKGADGAVSQRVEMTTTPVERGEYVYRMVVAGRPDERTTDDNAAEASVKVVDKKIKVLLVSGDAGHEFLYLKNYLYSQPEVYRLSVWQQNADSDVNQAASDTEMRLKAFPNALETILGTKDKVWPGYDVVILYDPMPSQKGFDEEFAKNLRTAVEKHGLGLCYLVGNKYSALTLGTNSPFGPVRALLPVVVDAREIPDPFSDRRPEPWPVAPTGFGLEHPAMQMGAGMEETKELWSILPGIFWSHSLRGLKPAARVLAEHSNPMRRLDGNVAEPLVATQPFGRGRVLYVNFDETWRWRLVDEMKYYRRFWSNVIQYLAPTSALQVIITTGGSRFSAGDRIEVEVEAYDDDYQPLKKDTYALKFAPKGTSDETEEIVLRRDEKRDGRYKGVIPRKLTAHVGTYVLTPTTGQPDKIEPKEVRIVLPQAEMMRPEADWVAMETLASRREYAVALADADQLASKWITAGRLQSTGEPKNYELWNTYVMLTLIVGLLTIEWIVRKVHNMA